MTWTFAAVGGVEPPILELVTARFIEGNEPWAELLSGLHHRCIAQQLLPDEVQTVEKAVMVTVCVDRARLTQLDRSVYLYRPICLQRKSRR